MEWQSCQKPVRLSVQLLLSSLPSSNFDLIRVRIWEGCCELFLDKTQRIRRNLTTVVEASYSAAVVAVEEDECSR